MTLTSRPSRFSLRSLSKPSGFANVAAGSPIGMHAGVPHLTGVGQQGAAPGPSSQRLASEATFLLRPSAARAALMHVSLAQCRVSLK
jgi:hypothetical protein